MLHMSPGRFEGPKGNGCKLRKERRPCLSHHLRPAISPSGGRCGRGYPSGMPRIYTKTGDDGTTGLLFGGRVSKADAVPDTCGTLDEAVAALGLARALAGEPAFEEGMLQVQRELFVLGADLEHPRSEEQKSELHSRL